MKTDLGVQLKNKNAPSVFKKANKHMGKQRQNKTIGFLTRIVSRTRSDLAEKEGFEPSHQSPQSTPLAGEPLTAAWVLLLIRLQWRNGGERGIRTPGAFQHHWFSRPAPSTPRPSLRDCDRRPCRKHLFTIAYLNAKVNPRMKNLL